MKKLLVLLVVLGIVSTASAGVIDIQIAGGAKAITVGASDTVTLEITYDSTTGWNLFGLSAFVNVTGPGTLSLASTARASTFDATLESKGTLGGQQYIVEAASMAGVPAVTGQLQLAVTNITIHVDNAGPDILVVLSDYAPAGGSLEVTADFGGSQIPTYGSGVVIHTPEPMTMMLLGLGSLFLVRRKK